MIKGIGWNGHQSSGLLQSDPLHFSFGDMLVLGARKNNSRILINSSEGTTNLQLCEVQIPLCTKQITVFVNL